MGTYKQIKEKRVTISQLRVGMYVSKLDRPWSETPFIMQGFRIKSEDDIDEVKRYCNFVFIDEDQTVSYTPEQLETLKRKPKTKSWKREYCLENYRVTTSIRREMTPAMVLYNDLSEDLTRLSQDIQNVRHPDISTMNETVTDMVESVIRNPDAFAWLSRIKGDQKDVYLHAVRLATWGSICGRQLGLNRFALVHLSSALLLTAIGKSTLSKETRLTYLPENPPKAYQKHLGKTLEHVKSFRFSNNTPYKTVENYCERYDGSGYPKGLKRDNIPFLSQVAGLVETFELAINPYRSRLAVPPSDAIAYINKMKGKLFEPSLVEAFVQAIGLYPTGTLVELSDKRIGIVVSQNTEHRLRATILPLSNTAQKVIQTSETIELGRSEDPNAPHIVRGIASNRVKQAILLSAHQRLFNPSENIWHRMSTMLNK